MMDGITVFATNIIQPDPMWLATVCFIMFGVLLILGIICLVVGEGEADAIGAMLFALVFATAMLLGGMSVKNNRETRTQYVVTISESVSMIEFNENYTVISQNDQLYTITEKE
jgi:hypothetical protein